MKIKKRKKSVPQEFKMQNFTPFWILVTSRFINAFFRKNSHPLSDTKVDHYSEIQGYY